MFNQISGHRVPAQLAQKFNHQGIFNGTLETVILLGRHPIFVPENKDLLSAMTYPCQGSHVVLPVKEKAYEETGLPTE